MLWIGLIIAFVVFATILSVITSRDQKIATARRNQVSAKHPMDELYVSTVGQVAVGINFADCKIVLGRPGADKIYNFDQIAAVEVVENGATVSQTNRGSQLAGAAIGGLVFGGLGALIGGTSGSTTTRQNVSSILLKVTVDDRYEPVHNVYFLKLGGSGIGPDHALAVPARQAVERIHAHLVNAMRQVQRQAAVPALPAGASADQLGKLWDMRQAGALTDDEFQRQKTMLLASGTGAPAALIPAEPPGRRYRVILVHPGETRWQFSKAFMASIPEFPNDRIAKMMQSLPAVILSDVGKSRAEAVQAALTAAGATVEIQ